jgi:CspA family cold shock protein
MNKLTGKVCWYNNEKGFGFITSDNGRDLFLHYSQIDTIFSIKVNEGDLVSFQIRETRRGDCAIGVKFLEK